MTTVINSFIHSSIHSSPLSQLFAYFQPLNTLCDAAVIVLNKPAGLASQGGTGITHSVIDIAAAAFPAPVEAQGPPRLVHRLDRGTSGVMILARNTAAAAQLGESFRAKTRDAIAGGVDSAAAMKKLYWAVVEPAPMLAEGTTEGEINLPLTTGPEDAVVAARRGEVGLTALTRFRVMEQASALEGHGAGGEGSCAWLELEPRTGRKHQLRAHCAVALKSPVVGDALYGWEGSTKEKLHLHARYLELPHPAGEGEWIRATAPLPAHMLARWRATGLGGGNGG